VRLAGWLAPSLEVDAMGVLEGTELLLRRAQRFAQATDEQINEAANRSVGCTGPDAGSSANGRIERLTLACAVFTQRISILRISQRFLSP
jgi:hypothetical protein